MNGHSDGYDYAPDYGPIDDDPGPEETGIECPFCGHPIYWNGHDLACDNCGAKPGVPFLWPDRAAVERDRERLTGIAPLESAKATDEYMYLRWFR